jgi:iduronate 2-sulfatase
VRRGLAPAILLALLALACGAPRPPSPRVDRPNVLLLLLDRVGTDIAAFGGEAETPYLDRLAARGRRFDRAYAQYPALGPSRLSILTGRRPERARLWDEVASRDGLGDAVALPEAFHERGYFTARVGRVVGGTAEAVFAWDRVDEPGPEVAGKRAQEVLAERPDRPFFLAVSFESGDPRRLPPAEYVEAYDPRRVHLPPTVDPRVLPPLALADAGTAPPAVLAVPDEHRRRQRVAELARVSQIDAQVGALVDALDRPGLGERTVVVVVADTPASVGAGRRDVLLEDALRAPLIVAGPGVEVPGDPVGEVVELVDVFPTVVELASIPPPPGLDGKSLVSLFARPRGSASGTAFSATRRAASTLGTSVRGERYRYTEWPDGSRELFDHSTDPGESRNVAASPEHEKGLAEMKALLGAGPGAANAPRPAEPPASSDDAPGDRPNVVLIVIDDLAPRLGCYGAGVPTPVLDHLAREGRRFDRAYCQVSSCSPSRTSFLTGRRPEKTGVLDNLQPPRERLRDAVPLQEHFHAQGYFTARVGKVYHGPFEEDFAWDVAEHTPYLPEDEANEPPPRRERLARGGRSLAWTATANDDEDEPDGRTARRVARLIEEHDGRPFFIAVGFNKPHIPWVAPARYFAENPPEKVALPAEPAEDWTGVPEIAVSRRPPRRPGLLLSARPEDRDEGLRRQAVAAYDACVSFVDAQVGVVLDALERRGLREKTIIAVVGDHGYHLGDKGGLWRKNTLYEASLRVPLIVAAPGLANPGAAASGLVELVDLYPTLVDLAGLPFPAGLDGTSLKPVLDDPQRVVKKAAFSVAPRLPPELGRSVRTARWRYTLWPDGSEELYDLAPGAWTRLRALFGSREPPTSANLAGDTAQAGTRAEMRQLIDLLDAR